MTMMEILERVAQKHGITVEQLKTIRYDRAVVRALAEAVDQMRGEGYSLKRVARATGRTPRSVAAYFYGERAGHRMAAPKGTAVYVRGAYLAKLRERATKSETTIPALVNQAVEAYLRDEVTKQIKAELRAA